LGQIYAYGLGVKENIPKGIAYLQEVNDDEAKQHIANFRKGLFGSWKRRKV
jgi:TPR repeat protein